MIFNDELGEMESCDSLDDEDFSDDTSSCSELDSDPEQDHCGRTISPVTTYQPRGRPHTRGGNARRARTRAGIRTGGGNRNLPSSKRPASDALDNQTTNQPQGQHSDSGSSVSQDSDSESNE